jgi:hypothetical protein
MSDVITIQGPGQLFGDLITNVSIPLVISLDNGDSINVYSDGEIVQPVPEPPVSGSVLTIPPLQNNNGQAGITFELTSTRDIYFTNLAYVITGTGNPFQLWYRVGGVQHIFGSVPQITASNGWNPIYVQLPASGTPSLGTIVSIPYCPGLFIPKNTIIGFFFGTNSSAALVRYQTYTSGSGEFSDGILRIRTATNVGYGGAIPSPPNHPRQFLGRVYYTSTNPRILTGTGYRYYRWQITGLRDFIAANSVQAGEFRFLQNGMDYSMSTCIVTNPQGNNPSGDIQDATKLIDGLLTTKWMDFNIKFFSYSEILFDFGEGQSRTFTGYRWATASDSVERDPTSWEVYGSTNGTSWTVLHSVSGFFPTITRETWQTSQTMTITGSFRYYRWYIRGIQSFSTANSVQVAEFAFQIDSVDQSMSGVSITNPNGANPTTQEPQKLVDGIMGTKWLDLNIKTNNVSNVVFDFGSDAPVFNGYRWSTADNSTERDPVTWNISGSNDNSVWTTLHTVSNFPTSTTRNVWQTQQTYGPYEATVTTSSATSITTNTATVGGNITNTNGIFILERGICYGTTINPTINSSFKTSEIGTFTTGSFTASLTALTANTLYYSRAYVTNGINATTYGTNITFTTLASTPTVTTDSGTVVSGGSSVISANIISIGGSTVTTRGVCWSINPNPTIALATKTTQTGSFGTGVFTATTSGMLDNTTYYVRAYATNSAGTGYGGEITVTSNPYVITLGVKAPVGSSGMTLLQNGSDDDSFSFNRPGITSPRTMQFSIPFYGISYNQPFFASNTYITFGSGSTEWSGLTINPPRPVLPALHLGTSDNSWQQCFEFTTANRYRFRYEGTAATFGTVGSPNIVYECTFFRQTTPSSDIYIELVFGIHSRSGGNWGMTNGSTSSNVFTIFGNLTVETGLVGTSGALQANRSYVLVLTSTGQFKNLYSGYYIVTSL